MVHRIDIEISEPIGFSPSLYLSIYLFMHPSSARFFPLGRLPFRSTRPDLDRVEVATLAHRIRRCRSEAALDDQSRASLWRLSLVI